MPSLARRLFAEWLGTAFLLAVAGLSRRKSPEGEIEEISYRAMVDLYAIRRRLEVAQYKAEVRRDGARLRREMRNAIDRQRAREKYMDE